MIVLVFLGIIKDLSISIGFLVEMDNSVSTFPKRYRIAEKPSIPTTAPNSKLLVSIFKIIHCSF